MRKKTKHPHANGHIYDNGDGTFTATSLWRSRDGKYVVCQGPFPFGMTRTPDSKEMDRAVRRQTTGPVGVMIRAATTRPYYAKVLASTIVELMNDLGEVAP